VVNGYVQIDKTHDRYYTPENYRAFFTEIKGQTPEETDAFLEEKTNNISEGNIEDYPMPLVYDMMEISAGLRDYPNYLNGISDNAQNMLAAAIWDGENTFSYRNIKKTPSAYQNITETNLLPLQPSLGIEDATNGRISSICGIFLVFLIVSVIFLRDRELGIMPILYATKNGRGKLFLSKCTAATICVTSLAILFFLENLIIGETLYGLGNLSRPMQTIYGFYTANLPISIGAYLLLYCCVQVIAYLFFAAIFMLICMASRNNMTVYGVSIGICVIFVLCYYLIPTYSTFALFHYWNPVQLLHTNEIFAAYVNVNFFGFPISSKISIIVLIFAVMVICMIIGNMIFSRTRNLQYKKIGRTRRRKQQVHNRFWYTMHRYLFINRGIVLVLGLIAFSTIFSANIVRTYSNDDIYYENFMTDYAGTIDDDTIKFIQEKQKHYIEIQKQIDELQDSGNPSEFQLSKFYAEFNDHQAFERLVNRVENIKNYTDSKIFYDTGYERLFGLDGGKESLLIHLCIMAFLALLIPSVPATDRKSYAMRFIRASRCGKTGYRNDLLIFSVLAGCFATIITTIPYTVRILQRYGTQGLLESAHSITGFSNIPVGISILGMMFVYFLLRMIISCLTSIFCAGISTKTRSPVTAHLICVAIFVLPIMICLVL
jgi:hypothetical protein